MKRQFIAVVPNGLDKNHELKILLGKLKRTVEEREITARWVAPNLWHVTLAFLGNEAGPVEEAFFGWKPSIGEVELRLQGLGAFPSADEGRVLWVGVRENQAFLDLQASLLAHLRDCAVAFEGREFNPHLTLARFRNMMNLNSLVDLGGRRKFGDYKIAEVVLFESALQGNIIKYVPVARRPLL